MRLSNCFRLFFLLSALSCQAESEPKTSASFVENTPLVASAEETIPLDPKLKKSEDISSRPTTNTFAFDEEFLKVQRTRHLEARGPLSAQVLSSAKLRDLVENLIERDIEEEHYANETLVLKGLELLPWSLNRKQAELSLLGDELNGLYDPKSKTFVIAEEANPELRVLTIFHELTHALQDQHFDLERILKYRAGESDKRAALHSFAEGDALLTMVKALFDGSDARFTLDSLNGLEELYESKTITEAHPEVPKVLSLSAVAPYRDGLKFVKSIYQQGQMAALNRAWLDPPTTTAQILHPELYRRHEPAFFLPALAPPPHFTLSYSESVGEQALRVVGEAWTSKAEGEQAATGWRGDRLSLYSQIHNASNESVVEHFVYWHVAMEKESDREEFVRLLKNGLMILSKQSKLTPDESCWLTKIHGVTWQITENQNSLKLLLGPMRQEHHRRLIDENIESVSTRCEKLKSFEKALIGASVH